jgi:hypothetical protein
VPKRHTRLNGPYQPTRPGQSTAARAHSFARLSRPDAPPLESGHALRLRRRPAGGDRREAEERCSGASDHEVNALRRPAGSGKAEQVTATRRRPTRTAVNFTMGML